MFTLSSIAIGIAVLALSIGLPAIFKPAAFGKGLLDMFAEESEVRILGLINMLFAFFILNTGIKIVWDSTAWIIVLGWLLLLRGATFLWKPEFVQKRLKVVVSKENNVLLIGLILLAVGILYGYLGLYVY